MGDAHPVRVKIQESGWYEEGETFELIATNQDEMVEYLDDIGELNDLVAEYIEGEYDFSDFIESAMDGCLYLNRDDMVGEFKKYEVIKGEDFSTGNAWYSWYDAGDTVEMDASDDFGDLPFEPIEEE